MCYKSWIVVAAVHAHVPHFMHILCTHIGTMVISHVACCVHVYISDVVLFATRTGVPQGKHTLLLLYAIMHLHILMCVHVCPLPCTSLFANFVLQTNRVLQFVTSIRINVCQAFAQKICI